MPPQSEQTRRPVNEPPTAAASGFLLHVFHRTQGPDTVIFGVGRLESGGTFAFADHRDPPAFYVRAGDAATARVCAGREDTVEPCGWTTMDGEPVVQVRSRRVNGLRQVARRLHRDEVRTYEADVGLGRRYLADRGIAGPVEISGQWRPGTGVDRVYVDPELEPGDWVPELSVLALDIETTPDASEVLAALPGRQRNGRRRGRGPHLGSPGRGGSGLPELPRRGAGPC